MKPYLTWNIRFPQNRSWNLLTISQSLLSIEIPSSKSKIKTKKLKLKSIPSKSLLTHLANLCLTSRSGLDIVMSKSIRFKPETVAKRAISKKCRSFGIKFKQVAQLR
jgi:hypothetical protein